MIRKQQEPPIDIRKGGVKYDQGKSPMSLVPLDVVKSVSDVMAFGAKKYGEHNWKKGMDLTRVIDAGLRHVEAFMNENKSDLDEESGLHHLDHALCCFMFAKWYTENKPECDNRLKKEDTNETV